jgi:hypothetical protein
MSFLSAVGGDWDSLFDADLRLETDKLGYARGRSPCEHSCQTHRLRYGDGYIKIHVTCLARAALLDPFEQRC